MELLETRKYAAIVVGSGASGYACAVDLYEAGVRDVAIVTEGVALGTSRNTGSDKQTYYKLSLGGGEGDSVSLMANDMFSGGSVDGDIAICEAAGSTREFYRLLSLGVPFPRDEHGVVVGYKTDHDPRERATSAGPLTSKYMTEALEELAARYGIEVIDGVRVTDIIKVDGRAVGVVGIDKDGRLAPFSAASVVFATGGAAALYADSVYPECQIGSSGALLRAGAHFQNLTEWQYGLSSVSPRWNVSGSFMQVIPRFVSVDPSGEERYFLEDYFRERPSECLSLVFLKGYQWPFDAKKLDGSSLIDLLVFRERRQGRRVYLDYRENAFGRFDPSSLSEEARAYLARAGAQQSTPIERLLAMNRPAYELYLSFGVDLARDRLEISLCAQHCNGGAAVDTDWQTSIEGLYAVGELAGTHGVYRPGGSALNAGQVGARRAAESIAESARALIDDESFSRALDGVLSEYDSLLRSAEGDGDSPEQLIFSLARSMSDTAGAVRNGFSMVEQLYLSRDILSSLGERVHADSPSSRLSLFILRDLLYCRITTLVAMLDFCAVSECGSRGSALYVECEIDRAIESEKRLAAPLFSSLTQIVSIDSELIVTVAWREVRKIPSLTDSFETVWRRYRERHGRV